MGKGLPILSMLHGEGKGSRTVDWDCECEDCTNTIENIKSKKRITRGLLFAAGDLIIVCMA
jgi:hypothetical protein